MAFGAANSQTVDAREANAQPDAAADGAAAPTSSEDGGDESESDAREFDVSYPFDRLTVREPWELSEQARTAEGWEVSKVDLQLSNPLARALAPTVGLLLHGAGHFAMDEREAAYRLFAAEVASIAAVAIGRLVQNAGQERDGMFYVGTALQVAGGGVFLWSWLGDVVGVYKNATIELPPTTGEPTGLSLDLFYTSVFGSATDISSIAALGVNWRSGRLLVEIDAEYEPVDDYYLGRARLAFRIPVGNIDRSAVSVVVEAGEEAAVQSGWGRDSVALGLRATVDIGELLPSAAGILWNFELLGAADFYFYEPLGSRRFDTRNLRWHMPVETSVGMNLNTGIYVEVGYRHRPDQLIGGLFPTGGAFFQRASINPVDALGIEVMIEEGLVPRLWVGLRWQIFENQENR